MKQLILLLTLVTLTTQAQITNRLIVTQNYDSGINPPNIMYTVPPNDNRIYQTSLSNLRIIPSQVVGLGLEIENIGDTRYKDITYTPSSGEISTALGYTPYNGSLNPSGFLTSVPAQSWYSITGKPTTLSGYGITDAYPLIGNPSNFLTSITSSQVLTALGYTPYNGTTNPNGYLTTITSTQVTNALGYTPINLNGLSSQYVRADGTFTTFPTIPTNTNQLTNGSGFINQAGARTAISLTTIGNSGNATYDNSTGILNIPNYSTTSKSFNNNVSRTLNSNYTISTTRDAMVTYSVNLSVTNPLLAGSSSASAFLEYSTNGGSSWITISNVTNSSSVALAVTIALTQPNIFVLSGAIPSNALVRIRTTTSGTASATYSTGQEVYF